MRIALISCSSKKKPYKCAASEIYSESPRFRLTYELAKLTCDKVYILSARYGLLEESTIVEPYNETLKEKGAQERRAWAEKVLCELRGVTDLENDEFIILAGETYREFIINSLKNYWLPLKGKTQGEWIPALKKLIQTEKELDACNKLHMLFNNMPRLDWTRINNIPYHNGIYIMFERGQTYNGLDRIVRVGTHRAQNRLKDRLKDHFVKEDANGSIFRKNIGRVMLNKATDPYLKIWEMDTSKSEIKNNFGHLIDIGKEADLEDRISSFLRVNITFICFQVEEAKDRLRLEEGIISTLFKTPNFNYDNHWLGKFSPVPEIAKSGLWNRQGLDGKPLSAEELEHISSLVSFRSAAIDPSNTKIKEKVKENVQEASEVKRKGASDVREYIDSLLMEAKLKGEKSIDLVSGQIHQQLDMVSRMPQVCRIMFEKKKPGDEVVHTTPSGKSTTIKIRYYIDA